MVVGHLGVADRWNYQQFASSDYPIQSIGEICSTANILDQLKPSEFCAVTGLYPIMDLSLAGHMFANTDQGRRQRMLFMLKAWELPA